MIDGQQRNVAAVSNNFHRISSACDSGYSELDIYSTGALQDANNLRQISNSKQVIDEPDQKIDVKDQEVSYLDELNIYFNLDKMLEKTSHEENCFRELDLSICSEESKDCSCSEYSCSYQGRMENRIFWNGKFIPR